MEVEELSPDWEGRWANIDKLLSRAGPLAHPEFDHTQPLRDFLLTDMRVLVIGAGGLGCELLKNLALSGFRNLDVIDMDTIDVSNLNRQFLFGEKDVGQPKAVVAAKFVNNRVAGANIIPHFCKIQDKDTVFYRQFQIVVCGLDSIPARRWINGLLVSLVEFDDDGNPLPQTQIPMIDGGTEGFKGQCRVIWPMKSACFECALDTFPPQVTFPLCTIASTPRLPEHCIEYAKIVQWPQERGDIALDGDDPDHIQWLFEKASARANEYGILGVTYRLTQGVVKNIIPAVASTNAVIAAACTNEAFKIATNCSTHLNNYMMFNGIEGLYTHTFEYERKSDCLVCCNAPVNYRVKATATVQQVVEDLAENKTYQMKLPGIRANERTLYMATPPVLEAQTRGNLPKLLSEFEIGNGTLIYVTDPSVPNVVKLRVIIE